jgi:hypothetical protein
MSLAILDEETTTVVLDESILLDEYPCIEGDAPARWGIFCINCGYYPALCDTHVIEAKNLLARMDAQLAFGGEKPELWCSVCDAITKNGDWRTLVEIRPL